MSTCHIIVLILKHRLFQADDMVRYLNDFQRILGIKVRFNTDVRDIQRHTDTGRFTVKDQHEQTYHCRWVMVATGMWLPNNPRFPGHELVQTYQDVSTDPHNFEGHKVLILGRAHITALNNNLLDTYQLKSLDGLLEASVDGMTLQRRNGKLWVRFNDTADMVAASEADSFALREGYDDVISCLGFIFDNASMPAMSRRVPKYPAIKATYESQNIPGLYFIGTATHSLDFRRSAGGFIHGFRYTARALHRLLEWRNHGRRWPARTYHTSQLVNVVVTRINEAAGPYQMFGLLADIILFHNNNTEFTVVPEFPAALLSRLEAMTGLKAPEGVIVSVLEYGPDFSGPGKDTFRPDRATGDPLEAHRSNFLHPVFYFYPRLPSETSMIGSDLLGNGVFLPRPARVHHVLEDFLTQWTAPETHVLPLRRFLESCVGADLREFSTEACFLAELTTQQGPLGCHRYRSHQGWGFSRLDATHLQVDHDRSFFD
ncbi:hypothetical protein B566_EDAN006847 [Ephemera danica]|nr:hypothetical protein B566_EDAN006847 [Ephemera danica]